MRRIAIRGATHYDKYAILAAHPAIRRWTKPAAQLVRYGEISVMDLNPHPEPQRPNRRARSFGADIFVLAVIVGGTLQPDRNGQGMAPALPRARSISISRRGMLPYYTMLSFMRGAVAYVLSFVFTLFYARWAAYDRQAERFLIPLLDILQSLPLSAFLDADRNRAGGLLPHSNVGIELSCIIVIFTGQVWNMTFSFYYSLKACRMISVSSASWRASRRGSGSRRSSCRSPPRAWSTTAWFRWRAAGSSSRSSRHSTLGDQDYRVNGVGSYMSVAKEQHNGWAQFYAVIAMIIMIVAIDQLIWRPLIVWSNKFKLEDTEAEFQDSSAMSALFQPFDASSAGSAPGSDPSYPPSRRPVVHAAQATPASRRQCPRPPGIFPGAGCCSFRRSACIGLWRATLVPAACGR